MKNLFLLMILLFYSNIFSQTQKYQSVKTSQNGGRYEIIQSEIKRSNTFKLDKFSGKLFVFVSTKNDWFAWQEVSKSFSSEDTANPSVINYQIYMGGIAAKDCFLLNINTGITWVLTEDKDGNFFFQLF